MGPRPVSVLPMGIEPSPCGKANIPCAIGNAAWFVSPVVPCPCCCVWSTLFSTRCERARIRLASMSAPFLPPAMSVVCQNVAGPISLNASQTPGAVSRKPTLASSWPCPIWVAVSVASSSPYRPPILLMPWPTLPRNRPFPSGPRIFAMKRLLRASGPASHAP